MARAFYNTSAATDVQAVTGHATIVGWSVASAAATCKVYLRDGTTTGDPVVAEINLGAAGSAYQALPAVDVTTGIFVDRDGTNAAEVTVYVL